MSHMRAPPRSHVPSGCLGSGIICSPRLHLQRSLAFPGLKRRGPGVWVPT